MPFNDNLPAEGTEPWYTPLATAWTNLKAFVNGLETAIGAKLDASQKGANSGVASLDAQGKLLTSQLPAIALVEYLGASATQAAMLAKVGQQGDWTIRTDLGTTWVITGATPTQLASWTQLSYPTAPVTTVAGRTGAVTLAKADVGLSAADNTSDANKPVSSAQATALGLKADKTEIIVKGVLNSGQAAPSDGIWLRRPAP